MSDLERIHRLVDGECSAAEQDEAIRQLQCCAASKAEYETIGLLKETVSKCCKEVPNDELWKSCCKRLDAIDKSKRAESFISKHAWGLCTVFAAIIVGGAYLNRISPGNGLTPQEATQSTANLSYSAINPGSIGSWLQEKFGKKPIDVSANGPLQVEEGAYGTINGRRVANLRLRDAKGSLSLILVGSATGEPNKADLCETQVQSMNAVCWEQNGMSMMLVGNRQYDELKAIAGTIRN